MANTDMTVTGLTALASTMKGSFSTVEDMTRAFIRTAIIRGIFRPGQRLQQDAIAQLLGVSRMPVRASLRQLESEGLVTMHPHRGATVSALSAAEIGEIYELRVLLEGRALRQVVPRLSDEELEQLGTLAERVEEAAEDPYRWLDARTEFYTRLYGMGGPVTLDFIGRLKAYAGPYLLLLRVVEDPHGHVGIMPFLRERDVEGAVAWLAEHLATVSIQLQAVVGQELEVQA